MPVHYTENPSGELGIVGAAIRLPHFMMCQARIAEGQKPCGRTWTANTPKQFAEMAAERRKHELTCKGGLIVAGG